MRPGEPGGGAVLDVEAWLASLGLERYAAAFRANDVDREVLLALTDADLRTLGVASLGHRKRLLAAIGALAAAPVEASGPREVGRRPVAVLFCDLVGYTRLSATTDPERVHDLLQRFFATADRLVVEHGGTIDKHIGDCVMALFGAPRATGDDVDRAISCARALIETVGGLAGPGEPPLAVHIGLALGEVVAGPTGSDAHSAYTVTGDAVNLAARLADRAGAGEILVAESVRRAARGPFPFHEAGELGLDGLDRPVRALRIEPGVVPEPGAPATPFVGRRGELAQLEGLLLSCHRDGAGRTVLVRGEAGIGKSRLLRELVAGARGFRAHEALVLDFGGGGRGRVATELALGLLDLAPTASPEERALAAEAAVARGAVAADLGLHLRDLLSAALPPELSALRAAMQETTRHEGRGRALAALLRAAAAAQPRLLLVEDLHWADPAILGELAALARTVPECPALLLSTTRPEGDPLERGWRTLAADAPLSVIELGPLAAAEAEALAGRILAAEAEMSARCASRSGGNPLFLEQLARTSLDRGEDALPETVQSLVLARVDRLAARDRATLQAASVLGQRFEHEALRAVAADPAAGCDEPIRRGLVRPRGEAFLFAHALIRESVYASLLQERRRELHRRAAAWYASRDPLLRAEHLVLAEDPEAATALLAAARGEAAGARLSATRDLLARAYSLAREPVLRAAIATELGRVLLELGAAEPALAAFERALAAAEDPAGRAHARLGLAGCLRLVDRLPEALALVDALEPEARALGDDELLARVLHLRGNLLFPLGRIAACRVAHEGALEAARAAGSAELEARALGGIGDAAFLAGRLRTARAAFEGCVAKARAERLPGVAVANLPMAAWGRLVAGEPAGARGAAEETVEQVRATGRLRPELVARHVLFLLDSAAGALDAALAQVERAERLVETLGARRFAAENMAFRAELFRLDGRRTAALGLLREALAECRRGDMAFAGPVVLGGIVATTDDPEERHAALAEGRVVLAGGSPSHTHLLFGRDAIEGCLAAGELDTALALADALEAYTAAEPVAWASFWIARARALAALHRAGPSPALAARLAALAAEAERIGCLRERDVLRALAGTGRAGEARAASSREAP